MAPNLCRGKESMPMKGKILLLIINLAIKTARFDERQAKNLRLRRLETSTAFWLKARQGPFFFIFATNWGLDSDTIYKI